MSEKRKHSGGRRQERKKEIRWDRLDNTAHLFPVIAGVGMSNVYRVCAVLKDEIQEEALQRALDIVLPGFPVFNVRLRQGMFWYYFEENGKAAPRVTEESTWPCRYIEAAANRNYLFRVTYYKKRINLEVFHVLTDGMGAFGFLKELIYQYLRLTHRELAERLPDRFADDTSLDCSDGFLENYRKPAAKGYQQERAFHLKGKMADNGKMAVIHDLMPVAEVKAMAKKYDASMNEYLVAAFIWSICQSELQGRPCARPVTVCVPVNLRPYFGSETTKNFFVVVTASFHVKKETYTFEEVLDAVKESLRPQLTREHLEEVFSYNVSNEKRLILRAIPLELKKPAMRYVYRSAAKANTTTVSNLGVIRVQAEYQPYIEQFYAIISRSRGQNVKACVCSYEDTLAFSISSVYADTSLQETFCQFLQGEGISVRTESNSDSTYPVIHRNKERSGTARRIYLLAAAVGYLILLLINRKADAAVRWDLIAGAAFAYGYLTWNASFVRHNGYMRKVFAQTFWGLMFIILIDAVLGFTGWSLAYVMPGIFVLVDVAVLILMIVNSRNWQSYLPVQLLMVGCSLIPIVLCRTHVTHAWYPAVGAFLISLVLFLGTLVIGRRRSMAELHRRFHL